MHIRSKAEGNKELYYFLKTNPYTRLALTRLVYFWVNELFCHYCSVISCHFQYVSS